jgi:hypothetical protein
MYDGADHAGTRPGKTEAGNRGERETQLFLLRLWLEEDPPPGGKQDQVSPDNVELPRWQGKVQHVIRGEAHGFSGWEMMVGYLEAMLLRDRSETATEGAIQTGGQEEARETRANRDNSGTVC